MKRILLMLIVLSIGFVSCSKDNSQVEDKTKTGSLGLKFTKSKTLTSGGKVEENFAVTIVQIWKADNKELIWAGYGHGQYATEVGTNNSFKADYQYANLDVKNITLPVGRYFIAIMTDLSDGPKAAHSYTNFNIKEGENTLIAKNVTDMKFFSYSPW